MYISDPPRIRTFCAAIIFLNRSSMISASQLTFSRLSRVFGESDQSAGSSALSGYIVSYLVLNRVLCSFLSVLTSDSDAC